MAEGIPGEAVFVDDASLTWSRKPSGTASWFRSGRPLGKSRIPATQRWPATVSRSHPHPLEQAGIRGKGSRRQPPVRQVRDSAWHEPKSEVSTASAGRTGRSVELKLYDDGVMGKAPLRQRIDLVRFPRHRIQPDGGVRRGTWIEAACFQRERDCIGYIRGQARQIER